MLFPSLFVQCYLLCLWLYIPILAYTVLCFFYLIFILLNPASSILSNFGHYVLFLPFLFLAPFPFCSSFLFQLSASSSLLIAARGSRECVDLIFVHFPAKLFFTFLLFQSILFGICSFRFSPQKLYFFN